MATQTSGEKIGEIFVEIRARLDKLDADFKNMEARSVKTVNKMEEQFARARVSINTQLMQRSLGDVEKMQAKLRAKLEEKIKMNADLASIKRTRTALNEVESQLGGISKGSDKAAKSFGLWGNIKGIGASLGLAFGAYELINFTKQAIIAGAELEVLKNNFKGTEEDLELFRIATVRTVSDANLIKLSNQASDLGLSLQQQALFFSLAENAADKYGGSVEEGMSKVIMATEGNQRALNSLGIQKKAFEEIVKDLTKEFAAQGVELDAESLKQIRIQAILQATGMTIDEVKNKVQDTKDKIESFGTAWENLKTKTGLETIVIGLIDLFNQLFEWADKAGNAIDKALGTKELFGPGETTKLSPEREQNKRDLDAALSSKLFVGKNGQIKQYHETWKAVGKSVDEVDKHIQTLQNVQKTLVPGSKEWLASWREIEKLSKKIGNPIDVAKRKQEEANRKAEEELRIYNEQMKVKEENISKYYEDVKFADESYFQWKTEQYIRDGLENVAAGMDRIRAEEMVNERIKKLDEEYFAWKQEHNLLGLLPAKDRKKNPITGEYIYEIPKPDVEGKISKELDEQKSSAEEWSRTLSSGLVDIALNGENALEVFKRMSIQIAEMVIQAALFKLIWSAITGGIPAPIPGAHSGGEYVGTSSGVMKMAGGGSFIVPGGYPRDSFPLMVETGERVTVTPANQVESGGDSKGIIAALARVETKLGALNRNLINKEFNANIFNPIDGTILVKQVTAPNENSLRKAGVALEKL